MRCVCYNFEMTQAKTAILWAGLLLAFCFMLFLSMPYLLLTPSTDENIFLYEGLRVAEGAVPYRDFFDFIWPGVLYLTAFIIKLSGGVSLIVLRGATLLTLLAGLAVVWDMARGFLPKGWRVFLIMFLVMAHFPSSIQIQHHLFSGVSGLVAVYCLMRALRQPSQSGNKFMILSGVFSFLAIWMTQTLGALLIIAINIFFILLNHGNFQNSLRQAKYYYVALLTPALLWLIYMLLSGSLQGWWQCTMLWPFQGGYARTTSFWYMGNFLTQFQTLPIAFVSIEFLLQSVFALVFFVLPLLALGYACVVIVSRCRSLRQNKPKNKSKTDWELLLLCLTGVAFFCATLSYPSTDHFVYDGWILFLLAAICLHRIIPKRCLSESTLVLLSSVVFLGFLLASARNSQALYSMPTLTSFGTLEKQYYKRTDPETASALNQMITYIHQQLSDNKGKKTDLFVYNVSPEFYLLTDTRNPTRLQVTLSVYDTPEQLQAVNDSLRQSLPRFILYDTKDVNMFGNDPRFKNLRSVDYHLYGIQNLLAQHYRLVASVKQYYLYQRVENTP